MMMKSFTLLGCLGVLMLSGIASAQTPTVEDRMEWFQDAKFGMFALHPILRPGADEIKVESGRPEFLVLSDNSYSNLLPSLRAARPR